MYKARLDARGKVVEGPNGQIFPSKKEEISVLNGSESGFVNSRVYHSVFVITHCATNRFLIIDAYCREL